MDEEELYKNWTNINKNISECKEISKEIFDKYFNEGVKAFNPNENFYKSSSSNPYKYPNWIASSIWNQGHYSTAKTYFEQKYDFDKVKRTILVILEENNLKLEGNEDGEIQFRTPENYIKYLEY